MIEGNIPKETIVEDIIHIYLSLSVPNVDVDRDIVLRYLDDLIEKVLEDKQCYSIVMTVS